MERLGPAMSQQPRYSIEPLVIPNEADCKAINVLLPQLSSSAKPLSFQQFSDLVNAEANRLYVARAADGAVVGVMMLVVIRQLVGTKCWIEDVITDNAHRGQGLARRMMQMAIDEMPKDAKHVNLTSKLVREAAHGLYYGLGFKRRDETAVFRLTPQ